METSNIVSPGFEGLCPFVLTQLTFASSLATEDNPGGGRPISSLRLRPPLLAFAPASLLLARALGQARGGGFAIVCRGRFGAQQVVLKVLKQQTEEFAKQLKHEARTMLLCACPHVVTLIGTVGPCILMEPMECDLRPSLQRAVATPNTCSRGTRHSHGPGAHAAGHSPQGCDILASNQDPPFTTKLADFGLAVHTRAGMLSEPVGTLPFMAPELFLQR